MSKIIVSEKIHCVNPFNNFKTKVEAIAARAGTRVKVKCYTVDTEKGLLYVAYLEGDGEKVKMLSNPSTLKIRVEFNKHTAII